MSKMGRYKSYLMGVQNERGGSRPLLDNVKKKDAFFSEGFPKWVNDGLLKYIWNADAPNSYIEWVIGLATRGQKSLKLSNSMTWSDQNCPTKGAYLAIIFLLKKCVKFRDIFINSYFINFGYNTAYITDYEELLLSLD